MSESAQETGIGVIGRAVEAAGRWSMHEDVTRAQALAAAVAEMRRDGAWPDAADPRERRVRIRRGGDTWGRSPEEVPMGIGCIEIGGSAEDLEALIGAGLVSAGERDAAGVSLWDALRAHGHPEEARVMALLDDLDGDGAGASRAVYAGSLRRRMGTEGPGTWTAARIERWRCRGAWIGTGEIWEAGGADAAAVWEAALEARPVKGAARALLGIWASEGVGLWEGAELDGDAEAAGAFGRALGRAMSEAGETAAREALGHALEREAGHAIRRAQWWRTRGGMRAMNAARAASPVLAALVEETPGWSARLAAEAAGEVELALREGAIDVRAVDPEHPAAVKIEADLKAQGERLAGMLIAASEAGMSLRRIASRSISTGGYGDRARRRTLLQIALEAGVDAGGIAALIARGARAADCSPNGRNAFHVLARLAERDDEAAVLQVLGESARGTGAIEATDDEGRRPLDGARDGGTPRWSAARIERWREAGAAMDARRVVALLRGAWGGPAGAQEWHDAVRITGDATAVIVASMEIGWQVSGWIEAHDKAMCTAFAETARGDRAAAEAVAERIADGGARCRWQVTARAVEVVAALWPDLDRALAEGPRERRWRCAEALAGRVEAKEDEGGEGPWLRRIYDRGLRADPDVERHIGLLEANGGRIGDTDLEAVIETVCAHGGALALCDAVARRIDDGGWWEWIGRDDRIDVVLRAAGCARCGGRRRGRR